MFDYLKLYKKSYHRKKAPEAPKVVDLLEGLTANKQDVLKEAVLCQP